VSISRLCCILNYNDNDYKADHFSLLYSLSRPIHAAMRARRGMPIQSNFKSLSLQFIFAQTAQQILLRTAEKQYFTAFLYRLSTVFKP